MRENIKTEKDYTDWMVKTGGYAKDMTLRDHFAALAMQELLPDEFLLQADIVKAAYQVADAMLEERNK